MVKSEPTALVKSVPTAPVRSEPTALVKSEPTARAASPLTPGCDPPRRDRTPRLGAAGLGRALPARFDFLGLGRGY